MCMVLTVVCIFYEFASFGQISLALKQCISWEWSMGWLGLYLPVMDTVLGAVLFLSHSHCPSLWYGSPTRYDWSTGKTKMFPTFLRQFYRRDSGFCSFVAASGNTCQAAGQLIGQMYQELVVAVFLAIPAYTKIHNLRFFPYIMLDKKNG